MQTRSRRMNLAKSNPAKSILAKTLLLTTLLTLTACGSSRYIGKVIPGTVGRPIIVEAGDDRINNEQGIPGLEITVYNESKSGRAPAQLARTMTDEDGEFAISIPSAKTPRGNVIVRVTGDEIYSARSKTFLPRGNQFMLYTVVTREPASNTNASSTIDPTK